MFFLLRMRWVDHVKMSYIWKNFDGFDELKNGGWELEIGNLVLYSVIEITLIKKLFVNLITYLMLGGLPACLPFASVLLVGLIIHSFIHALTKVTIHPKAAQPKNDYSIYPKHAHPKAGVRTGHPNNAIIARLCW